MQNETFMFDNNVPKIMIKYFKYGYMKFLGN